MCWQFVARKIRVPTQLIFVWQRFVRTVKKIRKVRDRKNFIKITYLNWSTAGNMARRIASSSVNWASLAERVPANQRISFTTFKSKSDKYLRRLDFDSFILISVWIQPLFTTQWSLVWIMCAIQGWNKYLSFNFWIFLLILHKRGWWWKIIKVASNSQN